MVQIIDIPTINENVLWQMKGKKVLLFIVHMINC